MAEKKNKPSIHHFPALSVLSRDTEPSSQYFADVKTFPDGKKERKRKKCRWKAEFFLGKAKVQFKKTWKVDHRAPAAPVSSSSKPQSSKRPFERATALSTALWTLRQRQK